MFAVSYFYTELIFSKQRAGQYISTNSVRFAYTKRKRTQFSATCIKTHYIDLRRFTKKLAYWQFCRRMAVAECDPHQTETDSSTMQIR